MGGPAAATAFLAGFNRDAFAASIAAENVTPAGCLTPLWDTFRQTWPGGPSASELEGAIRAYRVFGMSLDQTSAIAAYALSDRMWTRTIKVGLTLTANSEVPNGFPAPTPGEYGIFEPAQDLSGPGSVGRGGFVGRITNKAAWAGLPNAGLLGMAHELESKDGNQNGSGGGPRSSISYAHEGAAIAVTGVATLAVTDMLDRRDAGLKEGIERQSRGITDIKYRNLHGHRDFSKGGWPYVGAGNRRQQRLGRQRPRRAVRSTGCSTISTRRPSCPVQGLIPAAGLRLPQARPVPRKPCSGTAHCALRGFGVCEGPDGTRPGRTGTSALPASVCLK